MEHHKPRNMADAIQQNNVLRAKVRQLEAENQKLHGMLESYKNSYPYDEIVDAEIVDD